MFLRKRSENDTYRQLSESIRKDLIDTLRRKGVNISKVQIDLKPGKLNVEVMIAEK